MSRQIDSCAARLQPHEEKQFRAMLDDAADLWRMATRLRLDAWQFYRDCTGETKQPSHKKGAKT
jgi:hypothetical protein